MKTGVTHRACFQTSKIAEEQNANKLISHIKQVMPNVKQPFICVQKGLFVLCSAFFFFRALFIAKKLIHQIVLYTSKGILLESEFQKNLVRY